MKSTPEEFGEHSHLAVSVLDELWLKIRPSLDVGADRVIDNAISTHDPAAARAYLSWMQHQLTNGEELNEEVRAYGVAALAKFAAGGVTLGQAFGVERQKRGNPRTRAGAVDAVNELIKALHESHGYKLTDSVDAPSAFEVAADLLIRHWRYGRKPLTLRDQFWKKRNK